MLASAKTNRPYVLENNENLKCYMKLKILNHIKQSKTISGTKLTYTKDNTECRFQQ